MDKRIVWFDPIATQSDEDDHDAQWREKLMWRGREVIRISLNRSLAQHRSCIRSPIVYSIAMRSVFFSNQF
jgi:hypothetical protein